MYRVNEFISLLVVGETILAGQLRASGFAVTELEDGEALFDQIWSSLQGPTLCVRPSGAIVCDHVCSPDAFSVIAALREEGCDLPVVVTRCRSDRPSQAVDHVECIPYPCSVDSVLAALERAAADKPRDFSQSTPGMPEFGG
jgi:hypothetical protein